MKHPRLWDWGRVSLVVMFMAAALLWCMLCFGAVLWEARVIRHIPACEEDQVLLGTGAFHDGRWDEFECGPARDSYHG